MDWIEDDDTPVRLCLRTRLFSQLSEYVGLSDSSMRLDIDGSDGLVVLGCSIVRLWKKKSYDGEDPGKFRFEM